MFCNEKKGKKSFTSKQFKNKKEGKISQGDTTVTRFNIKSKHDEFVLTAGESAMAVLIFLKIKSLVYYFTKLTCTNHRKEAKIIHRFYEM